MCVCIDYPVNCHCICHDRSQCERRIDRFEEINAYQASSCVVIIITSEIHVQYMCMHTCGVHDYTVVNVWFILDGSFIFYYSEALCNIFKCQTSYYIVKC